MTTSNDRMAAQAGHPLRTNQVLIGYTAITTTSASTSGPTSHATARTPATVITTAAAPNRMISARGIAEVLGSRIPLVVLGRMSAASSESSLMSSFLGSVWLKGIAYVAAKGMTLTSGWWRRP